MAEFRVAFVAHDYDATLEFFTEVLGLDVLRQFTDGGKGCIVLAADGQIEFFDASSGWGEPGVSGAKLAWEIVDTEAEHGRLLRAKAHIIEPPTVRPWGHKSLVVAGPDGWIITLFEVLSQH
jgi:lactoylglutathione lyase